MFRIQYPPNAFAPPIDDRLIQASIGGASYRLEKMIISVASGLTLVILYTGYMTVVAHESFRFARTCSGSTATFLRGAAFYTGLNLLIGWRMSVAINRYIVQARG